VESSNPDRSRLARSNIDIVAFQGEPGAYSEQAVFTFFGPAPKTRPCRTLKEVFKSVEDKTATFGVVPSENSLEGSVNQTYDLLLESTLKIYGEVKIRVEHCLLALPETKLEDIQVVFSHPQALGQCNSFLENVHAEVIPAYDTAGSAKMIKEKQLSRAASIASERAAELYGLKIVSRNISDSAQNFTRFFVIGSANSSPTGKDKTSVVFGTKHTPGSLQRALSELSTRKINLTKIESRPIKGKPWEYHFFVDFEGHYRDPKCATALEALGTSTTFLKILGSYPAAE